jgi:hypothetical protein
MKIQRITFQMGNDFAAIMECEHCGAAQELKTGYNDNYYHSRVIPAMTCRACGRNRAGVVPEERNDDGLGSV